MVHLQNWMLLKKIKNMPRNLQGNGWNLKKNSEGDILDPKKNKHATCYMFTYK